MLAAEPPSSGYPSTEIADAALIRPDWPAPAHVRAFTTTRAGGVSRGPYGTAGGAAGGLNLGNHNGDDPAAVAVNRARLRQLLPAEPLWLNQVHGTAVWSGQPDSTAPREPRVADAAFTRHVGQVVAIMTADCLPVLFCNQQGDAVGAAHAGWRGLAAGVLEATLQQLRQRETAPGRWLAWLGPAIGPCAFEVGDEVRAIFCAQHSDAAMAFLPTGRPGKWWGDLYLLARQRLVRAGVEYIGGGESCTVSEAQRFYSFRRDRQTGRMASLIWLQA